MTIEWAGAMLCLGAAFVFGGYLGYLGGILAVRMSEKIVPDDAE